MKQTPKAGFTIPEVMIALTITGFMLSTLYIFVQSLIKQSSKSHSTLHTIFALQEYADAQEFKRISKQKEKTPKKEGAAPPFTYSNTPPNRASSLARVTDITLEKISAPDKAPYQEDTLLTLLSMEKKEKER